MLRRWFLGWVVLAVAVVVTVAVFPGIEVDWHPGTYLLIAAVFAGSILISLVRAALGAVVDHGH